MSNLDVLKKFFISGTAEDDRPLLSRVFVGTEQLADVLSINPGTIRVLVGNKGVGKTAILEFVAQVAQKNRLPCLLLRPDDIDTSSVGSSTDLGTLKRVFYEAFVRAVSAAIGKNLRGLLTGEAAKLHAEARAAGVATEDVIQKTLTLLSCISVPAQGVDATKIAKDLTGKASPNQLIRALNTHLLGEDRTFLLLIDDTDFVASTGDSAHLNRIWGLVLAVRRLAGECPSVRAVVTLRTEVWTRLQSESKGARDQTDHIRPLVVNLRASDALMEQIILRRLTLAGADVGAGNVDPYTVFFSSAKVILPTSKEERTWDSFILKSARERPRDAIQLIGRLIDRAKASGHATIGSQDADEAMKIYSRERVDDLTNEFAIDCPVIRTVVESFSGGDFEMNFEVLRKHLRTIGSRASVVLRGRVVQSENDDDAIRLLALLHESGFLNARVIDKRRPRGFDHVLFLDEPTLVSLENWNRLQAMTWEIHPAFRTHLIQMRNAHDARK